MPSKYIVRQQIKDTQGNIVGYEILYHGENEAFGGEASNSNDFAAADTIYNFLTENTAKVFKGSLIL
jgi:EAL and modified HD-GYP domain-containing signal transduction protein